MNAASRNFRNAAGVLNLPAATKGCLLFTEARGKRRFAELRAGAAIDGWLIQGTGEACSVLCRADDGQAIIIIAGRQIVTREGLEVLAIACDHRFADGQPIVGIVQQINALGGLPVLPWGFGKWYLRRGRTMRRLVRCHRGGALALGDNGGRARLSRRPRLFSDAEAVGIPVLPGSDPLPFRSEIERVGSYGFVLDAELDERKPAETIVRALRMLRRTPQCYGRGAPLMRFARLQAAMQLHKRILGESS